MFYTIYKTTNLLTGKFYVGKHQTKELDDGYMGSGKDLRKDIAFLGEENFSKEIIAIYDTEEKMNLAEEILVVIDPEVSYNKCPGGKGGFGYINKNNLNKTYPGKRENNIKNLAKGEPARRLYYDSGRHNEIVSKGLKRIRELYPDGTFKNKKHKPETIEKLKNHGMQTGSKNSQFGTMWITNGVGNKKIKLTDTIPDGWYKGRIFKKI